MADVQVIGRVQPKHRGEYSASVSYTPLDIVTSGGSSYMCVQNARGIGVSNGAYWALVAQKGDAGAAGTSGIKIGRGDPPEASQWGDSIIYIKLGGY